MKPSFKFDKHIFPPDSSPFRRGMAIGVSISLALIVVLLVAYMAFDKPKPITRQNLPGFIVLSAVAATALPWTEVLPPGFWSMPGGILINGLILGTLIGGGIKFGPGKTL